MKNKIIDHITFAVIYLFILSLLRMHLDLSLIPLWIGGIIGVLILDTDYLFQVFLVQPELALSLEVKKIWQERKYPEAISLVYDKANEIKSVIFHTIFFQIIFYCFSFFVLTSSGSVLGQAMVLTAILHLLKEQIEEIRKNGQLSSSWFNKLNVNLPPQRQKIFVGIAVMIFLLFSSFIIQ